MGKKTPPFSEYPTWTEARFQSFIRSTLRQAWNRWPPKYEALNKSRRMKPAGTPGRHKYEHHCADCKQWFMGKEVQVDHITPCGSFKAWADLVGFVQRMFVGTDKLRILCRPCHKIRTDDERLLHK